MGLRFERSIKILPWLRVNLSRQGASLSIGERGASINLGRRGPRATVGLPGTGLSWSERMGWSGLASRLGVQNAPSGLVVGLVALVVVLAITLAVVLRHH